jgi:hypothetical protein
MSVGPPGGNGTIMRTLLDGYVSANARVDWKMPDSPAISGVNIN